MKLDILAFGAHPDDVELACSGTLLRYKAQGKKVGVVDLTKGELGTRGTELTRAEESNNSTAILGLDARENLGLADGWFQINKESITKVIEVLRKYRPSVVLANAVHDRHTDHGRGARLIQEAIFLSGLSKVDTFQDGMQQEPWRPPHLFHYIQYYHITPDFVVDVTDYQEKKMESILAYRTQFYDPTSDEPQTLISSEKFIHHIEARAREMGSGIQVTFGEGFTTAAPLPYDFTSLL